MIAVYFLAAIGGLCLLCTLAMGVWIFVEAASEKKTDKGDEWMCALTGEHCRYDKPWCNGCEIAEKHDRGGADG